MKHGDKVLFNGFTWIVQAVFWDDQVLIERPTDTGWHQIVAFKKDLKNAN